jgi:hypothetical protein
MQWNPSRILIHHATAIYNYGPNYVPAPPKVNLETNANMSMRSSGNGNS